MPNARKPPITGRPVAHRATSYDVARAAGVSQSAVSRCFTPGGSIAPKTRDRVVRIASELGYKPNALAQGLILGRTNLVGVLISKHTNIYYLSVLSELTDRLHARGMRVMLFHLGVQGGADEVFDEIRRHGVDGVISATQLSDQQVEFFGRQGIALVLYNRTSDRAPVCSVSCDSVAGEQLLVDGLLAAGHRRFGIIAGPADSFVGEERRSAAAGRLAGAGLHDVPVHRGDFGYESGGEALRRLLAHDDKLEAVVAVNDLMAIGAIDAAREDFGLAVPEQLSVVGFDGADPAGWRRYRVTSIRQPMHHMVEAAVTMLTDRIGAGDLPIERRLFAGEFVPGRSARLGDPASQCISLDTTAGPRLD